MQRLRFSEERTKGDREGAALAFSPDGHLLAVGCYAAAELRDVSASKVLHRFPLETGEGLG